MKRSTEGKRKKKRMENHPVLGIWGPGPGKALPWVAVTGGRLGDREVALWLHVREDPGVRGLTHAGGSRRAAG